MEGGEYILDGKVTIKGPSIPNISFSTLSQKIGEEKQIQKVNRGLV
jgi:hypothetical protein